MKNMMSQITPKHMLDNQILLKLKKILNSIEITLIVPTQSQSPLCHDYKLMFYI